jgi:hypothetical protein
MGQIRQLFCYKEKEKRLVKSGDIGITLLSSRFFCFIQLKNSTALSTRLNYGQGFSLPIT